MIRAMAGVRLRGAFGIDAPYVPAIFTITGVVLFSIGILSRDAPWLWCGLGIVFLAQAALYLYATIWGEFVLWRDICRQIPCPDDAYILDVGSGRGMGIIMFLTEHPKARGVSIDLWQSRDLHGNDPEVARRNADANGVRDRLYYLTEDMTKLPMPLNTFDVAMAYISIRTLAKKADRAQAVREMYRVVKSGGEIRIVDVQHLRQYRDVLIDCGATDIQLRGLGWRGWFGNPWYSLKVVTARKP